MTAFEIIWIVFVSLFALFVFIVAPFIATVKVYKSIGIEDKLFFRSFMQKNSYNIALTDENIKKLDYIKHKYGKSYSQIFNDVLNEYSE